MEIKTQNTLIGAGTGAVVGTAAGAAAGLVKTKDVRANLKEAIATSQMTVDAYVKQHSSAAKAKMAQGGLKPTQIKKSLAKIVEKAKADFPKVVEKAKNSIPELTKTRNKTFLTIAGIGLAAGTLIGAIVGRIATKGDK